MNIENKNFTNFQNVNLKGTGTDPGVLRLQASTSGGFDQTISFVQGNAEAPYLSVAGAGLRLGTGYISLQSRNTEGTLSTSASLETARAWQLPNKSGVLAIGGSFVVQLPAALANNPWDSTTVTVSGIRANDALVVDLSETGTYTYGAQGTKYIKVLSKPNNGSVTLDFYNLGNGTGYIELIASYTAVRS